LKFTFETALFKSLSLGNETCLSEVVVPRPVAIKGI
jgi:hypothetical protein